MDTKGPFELLPTELIEHIGDALLNLAVQQRQPGLNEIERAVLQVRTFHTLALVNTRLNSIFTPRLYHQIIIQSANSRGSFIKNTITNPELCHLGSILLYSERMNGSRFHSIHSKDMELNKVLLSLRNLTVLRIWKVICWKRWVQPSFGDQATDLTSLTHLRTLEILEPQTMRGLCTILSTILPQIERLVVSGIELRPYENGSLDIYSSLTELKQLCVRSTRFTFEMWLDGIFTLLSTTKLEEIELDSTRPFTLYSQPNQFVKVGRLDRWRDTLKVFRFRGDPIEEKLRAYLNVALSNCETVDIKEIPVEPGDGHSINMWMG